MYIVTLRVLLTGSCVSAVFEIFLCFGATISAFLVRGAGRCGGHSTHARFGDILAVSDIVGCFLCPVCIDTGFLCCGFSLSCNLLAIRPPGSGTRRTHLSAILAMWHSHSLDTLVLCRLSTSLGVHQLGFVVGRHARSSWN